MDTEKVLVAECAELAQVYEQNEIVKSKSCSPARDHDFQSDSEDPIFGLQKIITCDSSDDGNEKKKQIDKMFSDQ